MILNQFVAINFDKCRNFSNFLLTQQNLVLLEEYEGGMQADSQWIGLV
jgi:hypothetical protein